MNHRANPAPLDVFVQVALAFGPTCMDTSMQ